MRKVALVTGAGGGIGKAIVERLISDNISVAMVDISNSSLKSVLENLHLKKQIMAKTYETDITNSNNIIDCVKKVVTDFSTINFLVNCAGISTSNLIIDIPVEEWDRVFAVNTRSIFLFCKEIANNMINSGVKNGRIINISSQASKIGEYGNGAYSASKAAINNLTQVLGLELASYGIAVSAICPGYVNTGMMQKVFKERGPIEGMTSEQYKQKLLSSVPTGRMVEPYEIASLVSYLCKQEASQITGVTITIAGGKMLI